MTDGIAQISVEGVTRLFASRGEGEAVVALAGIDLSVARGEFVVFLGPSGCGKSTLLNIVAGFLAPSTGRILEDGVPISGPDRRRTVVFQDYALFPWMTVRDNIAFGLKARGVGRAERHAEAARFVDLVRLTGFEDRYPHEISGGMKQRAAIARALAPEPDIVLMDEPLGALDAQTRVLLQEEVARLSAATGKTVLFVTHSIDEAVFLADRIIVMSARPGRIRSERRIDLPRPRTPEIRASPKFAELVGELWSALKPEWLDEDAKEERR